MGGARSSGSGFCGAVWDAGPGRSSEGVEMVTGKRSQYGAATSSDSRDHLRLGPAGETVQSHLRAVPFVQKRL